MVAAERTFRVVVFVDSTGELVVRSVRAVSALEARRAYLRVMGRGECIVRVDGPALTEERSVAICT